MALTSQRKTSRVERKLSNSVNGNKLVPIKDKVDKSKLVPIKDTVDKSKLVPIKDRYKKNASGAGKSTISRKRGW